jgi:acyl carrier protein
MADGMTAELTTVQALNDLEREVAAVIVEGLNLQTDPSKIDPQAPIFGEGLGLDSIDALEIALLLSQKYGVTISQGDSQNQEIFHSLRALSGFVANNRKQ